MEQAIISFPSLGLEMNPPAVISLFGLDIHLYGVAIALGFLLAVLYCARRAPEFGLEPDNVYDVIIWALPIGVIGAITPATNPTVTPRGNFMHAL